MKILLVEDEKLLSDSIRSALVQEGFSVDTALSFREARDKLVDKIYDVVVLDLNLPGGLGFDLFGYIRDMESHPGVLIISVRDSLDDKLRGLNLGADDYLVKPFHLDELTARIRSIIRRRYPTDADELVFYNLSYDMTSGQVKVNGTEMHLTHSQSQILYYLLINKNRTVSKESLSDYVLKDDIDMVDSFDYIYTHIKNLRQKLRKEGSEVSIVTVYGMGYSLKKMDGN
ncbi:response regulator transcription factor [Siphonobacter aquaeclarae]|uniref:DNA-binding response regulator, OmpR family, contains REC and winged-helix (WHTH) domain n=1 Tax=Siphonobacter aquaeclarae TaxID=563176 RepID=A0A1G9PLY0_9BACT|nr:response regulator transcription factor [Siphonobacter aquaeclarae]SDL99816.1 DNA-binding response regulator, OmpR family, contains REC and winged-helix (wHTH) domain [Siphonobacter aquaeclarae]